MSTSRFKIAIIFALASFVLLPALPFVVKRESQLDHVTDLAVGNSHAMSLNFDAMGLVGLNDYIPGADVSATIQSFHLRSEQLSRLERVWIPVAPVYLFRDLSEPKYVRRHPFTIGVYEFIRPFYDYSQTIRKFWSAPKTFLFACLQPAINWEVKDVEEIYVDGAKMKTTTLDVSQLFDLANSTARSHNEDSSVSNISNQVRIMDFIQATDMRGVEIIFFTPPYTREYFYHPLLREYVEKYKYFFEYISENYPSVHFFDFHDLFDEGQYEYFWDDDHLNLDGAKVFSPLLFEEVKRDLSRH